MGFDSDVSDIMAAFAKKIGDMKLGFEQVGENLFRMDMPSNRRYFVEPFGVDGAGTVGLKLRYMIGTVEDYDEVIKNLVLNAKKLLDEGILMTAVLPRDDKDPLFMLAGQMVVPLGTSAEEVATVWFNNAFLNYTLFDFKYPGVRPL